MRLSSRHLLSIGVPFFLGCALADSVLARPHSGSDRGPALAPSVYANRIHDAGLLQLSVSNLSYFGSPLSEGPNARWRGGEYLYFSSIWIGAIGSDSQPHVSTFPELRPELDATWTIYESFEGIKNGARMGLLGAAVADDDNDGLVDEDFQNGLDDDGDGRIDEDFAAIGQQMLSAMYKDDTPEAVSQVPNHYPLNLLVRQRSFQWSADGINEFVGTDYEIINIGEQRLHELYFGLFFDGDIGLPTEDQYWVDDMVGWDFIDTTVARSGIGGGCSMIDASITTAFMWDAAGRVSGVFGTQLLDHTTDDTGLRAPSSVEMRSLAWFGDASMYPENDEDRYQLLAASSRPVANPLPGVAAGSGDGPDDYRLAWSSGSFARLYPGESLRFSIAHVIGEGFAGFRQNAATTWQVHNGRYIDADGNPNTGVGGKERCLQILEVGQEIFWDDPCDTLAVAVRYQSTPPCNVEGPHYVDADCDPCTGVLGLETPIRWLGAVAPPSPFTNLDPNLLPPQGLIVPPGGDGQVTIQWDNTSELWVDPSTGLRIFTGYRIWKVLDQSGRTAMPNLEDWIQIAEFRNDVPTGDPSHQSQVMNSAVDPVGMTEDSKPIYPIGRYEFVDTDVVNGDDYFYWVTAFAVVVFDDGPVELAGVPKAPHLSWLVCVGGCGPTPVRLLSFTVERRGEDARLHWMVADVEDHAGFHVYRGQSRQNLVRITDALLAGHMEYDFTDHEVSQERWEYWLEELSRSGDAAWHGPAILEPSWRIPGKVSVGMVTPNPFKNQMRVTYTLPESRSVKVSIHDLSGRRIRTLVNEIQGPGEYGAEWQARDDSGIPVATGLYFIRLEAGSEVLSQKVLFMR